MKRLTNYGFTLIELLVVIAIIGILAAVVLTSLGGAQEGAQNSNVQQTLGSVRSSAQLFYNESDFSYSGLCAGGTEVAETLTGLAGNLAFISGYNDASATEIQCNDNATEYAVSAPLLNNSPDDFWCVDSSGAQGAVTSAIGSATQCP